MDKYGVVIAPNTIRFERLLPGPIERVWAYLTESEKRAKWLASGAMDLSSRTEQAAANLEETLTRYVRWYNHQIPQKALGHISPVEALKDWQKQRPELFKMKVYNLTGLDT